MLKYLTELGVIIAVFILSYTLIPFYTNSDQLHYNAFYEQVKELDWFEAIALNAAMLSSFEPGYPTLVWIFSNIFEKTIFISFSNSLLALFFYKLAIKIGCNPIIAFLVLVSNFYFYVCYFSAERLKFSLIFFSLSLLYFNRKKYFLTFLFSSLFCHIQVIILVIAMYMPRFNWFKKNKIQALFVLFFLLLFFFQLSPYLSYKLSVYSFRYFDWEGVLKISFLFFFSLKYSLQKNKVFLMYLPILFFLLLLSGERVTIFAYFIFMYFAVQYKNGLNFGLISVNIYFLYKSIFFIDNVIKYGDGF
jgi:hypothetical protein